MWKSAIILLFAFTSLVSGEDAPLSVEISNPARADISYLSLWDEGRCGPFTRVENATCVTQEPVGPNVAVVLFGPVRNIRFNDVYKPMDNFGHTMATVVFAMLGPTEVYFDIGLPRSEFVSVDLELAGESKGGVTSRTGTYYLEKGDPYTAQITPSPSSVISSISIDGVGYPITDPSGQSVGISAVHKSGSKIVHQVSTVVVNHVQRTVPRDNIFVLRNVTASAVVDVAFEVHTTSFQITSSVTPAGHGQVFPAVARVDKGLNQMVLFVPDAGFHVASYNLDSSKNPTPAPAGGMTNLTVYNVQEDHTLTVAFARTTFDVTATVGVAGGGTVSPSGVTPVDAGAGLTLTLTLTPSKTHMLDKLTVDGATVLADVAGVSHYRIAAVSSDMAAVASFKLLPAKIYQVTLAVSGRGSVVPPQPLTSVTAGDTYSLQVFPDAGATIGSVSVDGKPWATDHGWLNLTKVDADHAVVVAFQPELFTLLIQASGPGSTVPPAGVPVTISYDEGVVVYLEPDDGADYTHSLTLNGKTEPVPRDGKLTIAHVRSNQSVVVAFRRRTFPVDITASAGGSTRPAGVAQVPLGHDLVITATAEAGHHIASESINGTAVTPASRTFVVSNVHTAMQVQVVFAYNVFDVTVGSTGGGAVAPNGTVPVDEDAQLVLRVTPDAEKEVAAILVDGYDQSKTAAYNATAGTFTLLKITQPHSVVVSFRYRSFKLTSSAVGNGVVDPDGVSEYAYNQPAKVYIIPDPDGVLTALLVDGVPVSNPTATYEIAHMTQDHVLKATFSTKKVLVIILVGGNGTCSPAGPSISVDYGADLPVTLTPDGGNHISSISINGQPQHAPFHTHLTLPKIQKRTVLAVAFAKNPPARYFITPTVDPKHAEGTILPATVATVFEGKDQVFYITPDAGYVLDFVLINGAAASETAPGEYKFQHVHANATIEVSFVAKAPTQAFLNISITPQGNNVASPYPSTGIWAYNIDQAAVVAPNPTGEYDYLGADIDHSGTLNTSSPLHIVMDVNHSATLHYRHKPITVTTTMQGTGTGTLAPAAGDYPYGQYIQVKATAHAGSELVALYVDGNLVSAPAGSYVIHNPQSNVALRAVFNLKAPGGTWPVTLSVAGGGHLNVSTGVHDVAAGGNFAIQAIPDKGMGLFSVAVQGVDQPLQPGQMMFELVNVRKDYDVKVTFAQSTCAGLKQWMPGTKSYTLNTQVLDKRSARGGVRYIYTCIDAASCQSTDCQFQPFVGASSFIAWTVQAGATCPKASPSLGSHGGCGY